MVLLVVALDAQQHFVGVFHGWLLDLHRLEPALQGGILLYKLTILGKSSSADHLNFAARERRLQDIRRVHGALTVAGAHQIVHLVNEQNNIALGLHLVHQTLDPALKLATKLGAGHQCGQVQQIDLFVCQARRHLPLSNANGQPLGNGSLTHARLADQAGVILGTAAQDFNRAGDLLLSADNGVQLAVPSFAGQVGAVGV